MKTQIVYDVTDLNRKGALIVPQSNVNALQLRPIKEGMPGECYSPVNKRKYSTDPMMSIHVRQETMSKHQVLDLNLGAKPNICFQSGKDRGRRDIDALLPAFYLDTTKRWRFINTGRCFYGSSYWMGYIEPIAALYRNKAEFIKHVDYSELCDTNRLELLRAVNRIYIRC